MVITEGGNDDGTGGVRESADEWIMGQLTGANAPSRDVEVSIVTADRLLRKEAQRMYVIAHAPAIERATAQEYERGVVGG